MDTTNLTSEYDQIDKNVDHHLVKPTSVASQYFKIQKRLIKTIRKRSLEEN